MIGMTNERKVKLFDDAMEWIFEHLVYADKVELAINLENIGFTNEEINEIINDMFWDEQED